MIIKIGYFLFIIGLIFVIMYYMHPYKEVRHLYFFVGLFFQISGWIVLTVTRKK